MSTTQSSRTRNNLTGQQRGFGAEELESGTTNHATPERFATSGTPHEVGGAAWDDLVRTSLPSGRWAQFWTAADGGESTSESEESEADGGEVGSSYLSGLMLERFDDDEQYRELVRTGRAL
jgi:hypothetical protein